MKLPFLSWTNWIQEHLPLFGMSSTRLLLEETGLLARIKRCEQFKKHITQRIERLDPEAATQYLGENSYAEWMMLYDTLIMEAHSELDSLRSVPDRLELQLMRRSSLFAFLVTFLFFLLLFFLLMSPLGIITGGSIGVAETNTVFDRSILLATSLFLVSVYMITFFAVKIRGNVEKN